MKPPWKTGRTVEVGAVGSWHGLPFMPPFSPASCDAGPLPFKCSGRSTAWLCLPWKVPTPKCDYRA